MFFLDSPSDDQHPAEHFGVGIGIGIGIGIDPPCSPMTIRVFAAPGLFAIRCHCHLFCDFDAIPIPTPIPILGSANSAFLLTVMNGKGYCPS